MVVFFYMNSTLLAEMQKRNISQYALMQKLGRDPKSNWVNFHAKLSGEGTIKFPLLEKICEAITEISGQPLKVGDLNFEFLTVKMV